MQTEKLPEASLVRKPKQYINMPLFSVEFKEECHSPKEMEITRPYYQKRKGKVAVRTDTSAHTR
jgi:hypothetical protein